MRNKIQDLIIRYTLITGKRPKNLYLGRKEAYALYTILKAEHDIEYSETIEFSDLIVHMVMENSHLGVA